MSRMAYLLVHSLIWMLLLFGMSTSLTEKECFARCGLAIKPTTRIYHGESETQNRWAAYIKTVKSFECKVGRGEEKVPSTWRQDCTGSVISSNYILTAAHCFKIPDQCTKDTVVFPDPKEVTIILRNGHGDKKSFEVEAVSINPKYRTASTDHDLALVKLKTSIKFDMDNGPVCLSKGKIEEKVNQATVYGYGVHLEENANQEAFETTDDGLRKEVEEIKSIETCTSETASQNARWVKEMHICGKGKTGGAAGGDSGGPLVATIEDVFIQIGVLSTVFAENDSDGKRIGQHDKFTSLNDYCEWIKKKSGVECMELSTDFAKWNDASCSRAGMGEIRHARSTDRKLNSTGKFGHYQDPGSSADQSLNGTHGILSSPSFRTISDGSTLMARGYVQCRAWGGVHPRDGRDVIVELWEEDSNFLGLDGDDFLGATLTRMDGTFEVKARREETEFFGSIDPYILLRHNCWNGWDMDKNCSFVTKHPLSEDERYGAKELELKIGHNYFEYRDKLHTWMECTDGQGNVKAYGKH